jgi:hypothetical protein
LHVNANLHQKILDFSLELPSFHHSIRAAAHAAMTSNLHTQ